MGRQLPLRHTRHSQGRAGGPLRKVGIALTGVLVLVSLTGCSIDSEELKRLGQPVISDGATNNTDALFNLWLWAWVAALLVGVLVWGLIGYCMIRFRRRSDDEIPVQVRYNLPLEVLYTIVPVIMVLVFFYFTVDTQEKLDHHEADPDRYVVAVGQQWAWTFNYYEDDAVGGQTVFQPGSPDALPTLYLPVGERVHFELHSPDVVHSFWVPGFLQKLDVVPGHSNSFQLIPTREGSFPGKCAELCGVYHSRMLFNVEVVSQAEYAEQLRKLEAAGNVGLVCGGTDVNTIRGLDTPNPVPDNDPENGVCR